MRVFVGLGANLGDRHESFRQATRKLSEQVGPLIAISRVHETKPVVLPGRSSDTVPPYLNAALALRSQKSPEEILSCLLSIETDLGRRRENEPERWMSRVLDLDLLGVSDECRESQELTLPHKEMHNREFVLAPLAEIAPDWIHPVLRLSVRELLARVSTNDAK